MAKLSYSNRLVMLVDVAPARSYPRCWAGGALSTTAPTEPPSVPPTLSGADSRRVNPAASLLPGQAEVVEASRRPQDDATIFSLSPLCPQIQPSPIGCGAGEFRIYRHIKCQDRDCV